MLKLYEFIDNWIKERGTKSFAWLYKEILNNITLLDELNESLSDDLKMVPLPQKIYHFYYKIADIPVCKFCNKKLKFNTFSRPYGKFCNRECNSSYQSENSEISNIKRVSTNLERYGVEYTMQSDELKNKYTKNSIEKYGVSWPSKSNIVREKQSLKYHSMNDEDKEKLEKHRKANYLKSIREKYNDSTLTSAFSLDFVNKKRKETNLRLYGNENTFLSPILNDKSKKTCIERYGTENPMQNLDIQKKHFLSNVKLKEYTFPSGKKIKTNGDNILALDVLLEKYKEEDFNVEFDCPIISYFYDNNTHVYRPDFFIKLENKIIEVKSIYFLMLDWEKNLAKFREVKNKGYNLEVWIYTHQKLILKFDFKKTKISELLSSLGINDFIYGTEYLLLFKERYIFRISDISKENEYDVNVLKYKLSLSNNQSFCLINIFSDLLDDKYTIVKSRILNILGYSKPIYARKCTIGEISNRDAKYFFEKTHIQGSVNALYSIGLFLDGDIVSVMSFGKKRVALGSKNDDGVFELLRFSSVPFYNVVGGASKLLKYFVKRYKPKKIITYADKNWSSGNLYQKIGFTLIGDTGANYYYCKDGKRYHRFNFRKDKLVSMGFSINETESVIMKRMNYIKLYDCGNIKFEMCF